MSGRRLITWAIVLAGAAVAATLTSGGLGPIARAPLEVVTGFRDVGSPGLPLGYDIGSIDPRFGVSRERVLELADEARTVWETAAGRDLFRLTPGAALTVSLVFDWRQEKLLAALAAKGALDGNGQSFDRIQAAYNEESRRLQESKIAFEADVARLRERVADYSARVARWNEGTARIEGERRLLDADRKDLEAGQAALVQKRTELNDWIARLAGLSDTLNGLIAAHNLEVENFNGTYVRTRDFEKGVFDGTAIRIYEFEKDADLKLTIIHEFGHALGLPHVEDPRAIMNRKLALQDLDNITLAPEDVRVLRERLR